MYTVMQPPPLSRCGGSIIPPNLPVPPCSQSLSSPVPRDVDAPTGPIVLPFLGFHINGTVQRVAFEIVFLHSV